MVKYFEYNISFNITTTPWKDNYYGHLQMKNLNFSILSLYKLINKWQTQNSNPVLTSCIWFSSSTQNTHFFPAHYKFMKQFSCYLWKVLPFTFKSTYTWNWSVHIACCRNQDSIFPLHMDIQIPIIEMTIIFPIALK